MERQMRSRWSRGLRGGSGDAALSHDAACPALLYAWREGNANMRSV